MDRDPVSRRTALGLPGQREPHERLAYDASSRTVLVWRGDAETRGGQLWLRRPGEPRYERLVELLDEAPIPVERVLAWQIAEHGRLFALVGTGAEEPVSGPTVHQELVLFDLYAGEASWLLHRDPGWVSDVVGTIDEDPLVVLTQRMQSGFLRHVVARILWASKMIEELHVLEGVGGI
jgi:hypothetical protein